jgi:hypothetical protein
MSESEVKLTSISQLWNSWNKHAVAQSAFGMGTICVQHQQMELGEKLIETGNCNKQPHETVFIVNLKSNGGFWVKIAAAAEKLGQKSM